MVTSLIAQSYKGAILRVIEVLENIKDEITHNR